MEMDQLDGISFKATLAGVRTTADGGWKITLDVPASEADQLLDFAKHRDKVFQVAAIPHPNGSAEPRERRISRKP